MNLWLLFVCIGLLTLGERIFFILQPEGKTIPLWLDRMLKYVPVVTLAALVSPVILRTDGAMDVSVYNAKLWAGLVSLLVAWKSKNVLLTIIAGMAVIWGLSLIPGF